MRGLITLLFISAVATGSFAQIKIGKQTLNVNKAASAAGNLVKSATLTDADVAQLSKESVDWMDAHNPIDKGKYAERLERLTKGITEANGIPLNFKVYYVTDINAFACADGSIRVFSSLMDLMSDDELMAIIGHEIGHVVNHDTKDAIKSAYQVTAATEALGAVEGTVSKLTQSQLGSLTKAFLGAKFSQKQEYQADEYGFNFCIQHKRDPYAMANSLNKLVELSKGAKASAIQQMFSSHPDSEKRAALMKKKADALKK